MLDTGAFTATTVILLWGVVYSFALEYLWFVRDLFDKLEEGKKKTVNAAGIFIVALGAFILSALGYINAFTPDFPGLVAMLTVFFTALGVNTGVHYATKRAKS